MQRREALISELEGADDGLRSIRDDGGAAGGTEAKSRIALFLLLPGILYLVLFFLTPLISLILTSLQAPSEFGDIGVYDYAFNWQNYVVVSSTGRTSCARSATPSRDGARAVFSYPIAYFIGVKARRWPLLQSLMLVLVIAPFFISFLLRTLAWKQILSDESFIITSLKALSLLAPTRTSRARRSR